MQLWFTPALLQLFSLHKLVANTEWQIWGLGIMETSKYVRTYQFLENLKNTALTLLSIIGCCVVLLERNQQKKKKNPVGAEL